MGYAIQKDTANRPLLFLMIDSADHLAGKAGLSPTVTISKNGGSFAAPAGAVSEIANGWYSVAAHATDSNSYGPLKLHAEATGADPCDESYEVVAYNPDDPIHFGLTALPNAAAGANGGLPTGDASGRVQFQVGTEAGKLDTVSGAVKLAPNQDVRSVTGDVAGSVGGISGVTFPENFAALVIDASGIASANLVQIKGFETDATTLAEILNYYGLNSTLPANLSAGERTAIANAVEAEIIDETDSEKVLTAITNKIAAVNPDLSGLTIGAIAAGVWSAGERTVTGTNKDADIAAIKAKTDNLPADPASNTQVNTRAAAGDGMALTSGERTTLADVILARPTTEAEASASDHSLCYVILAMSEADTTTHAGKLTVFRSDGTTEFAQKTIATDAAANPITGVQ